jgi:hypothetical protein
MAHGEETALNLGRPACFLCMMRVPTTETHSVVRVQRLNLMKIFHEVLFLVSAGIFYAANEFIREKTPSLLCLRDLLLVSSPSREEDSLKSAPPGEGAGDYEVLLMISLVMLTINRKYHQRYILTNAQKARMNVKIGNAQGGHPQCRNRSIRR